MHSLKKVATDYFRLNNDKNFHIMPFIIWNDIRLQWFCYIFADGIDILVFHYSRITMKSFT